MNSKHKVVVAVNKRFVDVRSAVTSHKAKGEWIYQRQGVQVPKGKWGEFQEAIAANAV